MKYLKQTVYILALAGAAALAVNHVPRTRLSIADYDPRPDVTATAQQQDLPTVDLAEAFELYHSGGAVFVDARPSELFAQGRIPGAFNVPEKDSGDFLAQFTGMVAVDEPVVVYCDGDECLASVHVAEQLRARGYRNVSVFFGGWMAWTDAAHEIEWD
ncbi:MAG: rhodanese-like domain-containing protein [Acidobacteria bacterium]|nr:rhodanese-like domain-containing protein [Acidobacteriota bacterium]